MSRQKQTTLDSWKTSTNKKQKNVVEDHLDDDDLMDAVEALEQSLDGNDVPTTGLTINGFDNSLGKEWIYPTNYPVRDYQFNIVKTCLYKNTLVSLPTGLGKTFIAAVVMYNFYRWFPQGKIIFLAPTKPLVAQQITACHKIMGIPFAHQAEITGATMASSKREELWRNCRMFFLTPQCLNNDMTRGVCPINQIKCVVFDEAHKALGNYAYCQVIQQLQAYGIEFRVLALSATPGSNLVATQQIITNLQISTIELRSEESIDIQRYTHSRKVAKIVVKLNEQILGIKSKYLEVIQYFINSLVYNGAIYNKDASRYTKFILLMERERYRKNPPAGVSRHTMGIIEGDFAICLSLYHGMELLVQHGMKSFHIFVKGTVDGSKGNGRTRSILQSNPAFCDIMNELEGIYGENPDSVVHFTQMSRSQAPRLQQAQHRNEDEGTSRVYSHPKFEELEKVVLEHFRSFQNNNNDDTDEQTRVMIFCEYRESVYEITELLQKYRPLIRPMQFVGHQAQQPNNDAHNTSKPKPKKRKFTQKDQLMVVEKFRSGNYNTLVATCVGEEGLDIGDVDLIVCFDSHKSPIRLVQRMGRTGRKRDGKIVMLVTEGKEERDYNSSVAKRSSIHNAIMGSSKSGRGLQYFHNNPRMVPPHFNPSCRKMAIEIPQMSKPKKDGDVLNMIMKKKGKKSSGKRKDFLSESQHEDFRANLFLTQRTSKALVKRLPSRRPYTCLYLQKEYFREKPPEDEEAFSLTEWLPWQSRLIPNPKSVVGHSSRSKVLSEVLHFCNDIKAKDEDGVRRLLQQPRYESPHPPPPKTSVKDLIMQRRSKRQEEKKNVVFIISSEDEDFENEKEISSKPKKRKKTRISDGGDDDDDVIMVHETSASPSSSNNKLTSDDVTATFPIPDHLTSLFPPIPTAVSSNAPRRDGDDASIRIPTPPPSDALPTFDFLPALPDPSEDEEEDEEEEEEMVDHWIPFSQAPPSDDVIAEDDDPDVTRDDGDCDVTATVDDNDGFKRPDVSEVAAAVTSSSVVGRKAGEESSVFDASGDLFGDQFEPDFDLGFDFDAIEAETLKSVETAPSSGEVENVETASFGGKVKIGQAQRLENRSLFAELSCKKTSGLSAPPVAAVRPISSASSASKDQKSPLQKDSPKEIKKDVTWGDDDDDFNFDFNDYSALRSGKKKIELDDDLFDDDDDEFLSPAIPIGGRKKTLKIVDSPSPLKLFKQQETNKQSTPKCEEKEHERKKENRHKNSQVHRRLINEEDFVDVEAEVSGSDGPDDDEDPDDDYADLDGFVNDATQLTQQPARGGKYVDERAMYLQSMKLGDEAAAEGQHLNTGKYKLAYGVGHDIDVFSQKVEKDISDYMEDSFCVDDDDDDGIVDVSFDLGGDVTIMQSATQIFGEEEKYGRLRTRREKARQANAAHRLSPKVKRKKKVIAFVDDDDDDDSFVQDDRFKSKFAGKTSTPKPPPSEELTNKNETRTTGETRVCEVCGTILVSTKGWMCASCISLLKTNEKSRAEPTTPTIRISRYSFDSPCPSNASSSSSRDEQIQKSLKKQQELRERVRKRRLKLGRSCDTSPLCTTTRKTLKISSPGGKCSSNSRSCSPAFIDLTSSPQPTTSSPQLITSSPPDLMEKPHQDNLIMLVDTREVSSGANQLVQQLRTKHRSKVLVVSLQTCGFVIGNRCAVIRKSVSDLSVTANRGKLAEQLRRAHANYDQVYLIAEKDRIKQQKGWQTSASAAHPAKHQNFQSTLVQITQSKTLLLHSESQEETADLLYDLACDQKTKGSEITAELALIATISSTASDKKGKKMKNLVQIYSAIPGLSFVDVLTLCSQFKSFKEAVESSIDQLRSRCKFRIRIAEIIYRFFRHNFDIQMTPL